MHLLRIFGAALVFAFVPLPYQAAQSASSGELTPALVFGGAVTLGATIIGGIFLLIKPYIENRFAERDAQRAEEDLQAKNQSKLIDAVVVLGQAQIASNAAQAAFNAAQAEERKELRMLLQTKAEATDGRNGAVSEINTHTDTEITSLRNDVMTKLDTVFNELDAIRKRFGVDSPTLQDQIGHIEKLLMSILETMPIDARSTPAAANGDVHSAISSEPNL